MCDGASIAINAMGFPLGRGKYKKSRCHEIRRVTAAAATATAARERVVTVAAWADGAARQERPYLPSTVSTFLLDSGPPRLVYTYRARPTVLFATPAGPRRYMYAFNDFRICAFLPASALAIETIMAGMAESPRALCRLSLNIYQPRRLLAADAPPPPAFCGVFVRFRSPIAHRVNFIMARRMDEYFYRSSFAISRHNVTPNGTI